MARSCVTLVTHPVIRHEWGRDGVMWLQQTKQPSIKEIMIGTTSSEISINWEIYTPYAVAAGKLLHIQMVNGKFTIGKLKSSLLS